MTTMSGIVGSVLMTCLLAGGGVAGAVVYSGTLTDLETGLGVRDARIEVRSAGGELVVAGATGLGGAFRLEAEGAPEIFTVTSSYMDRVPVTKLFYNVKTTATVESLHMFTAGYDMKVSPDVHMTQRIPLGGTAGEPGATLTVSAGTTFSGVTGLQVKMTTNPLLLSYGPLLHPDVSPGAPLATVVLGPPRVTFSKPVVIQFSERNHRVETTGTGVFSVSAPYLRDPSGAGHKSWGSIFKQ